MVFQFRKHVTFSSHCYWESNSLAKDVSTHDISIHGKTMSSLIPSFKKDKSLKSKISYNCMTNSTFIKCRFPNTFPEAEIFFAYGLCCFVILLIDTIAKVFSTARQVICETSQTQRQRARAQGPFPTTEQWKGRIPLQTEKDYFWMGPFGLVKGLTTSYV